MRLVDGRLIEMRTAALMAMREGPNCILPREKGAAPLDVVIAVMAFLAALALGASLIARTHGAGLAGGTCRTG